MKRLILKIFTLMAVGLFLSISTMELTAEARAGGSRSSGSRGSRSYSRPASPSSQPNQTRQQVAPAPSTFQQQPGGGFMRSMAGGVMGGMLGSMLFSGFAGAGAKGMGGGGIGLFEIALLAGIGYLIYRYIKKKRADSSASPYDRL
jgi:predicted lipid-binding transport protein (Tim44 family)